MTTYHTHNGKTMSLTGWAKHLGVSLSALSRRLAAGKSYDDAFTSDLWVMPPMPAKAYTFEGRTLTLREWSKELGVSASVLRYRLAMGYELAEAFSDQKWAPKKETLEGKTMTIAEWSAATGINVVTIRARLRKGMTLKEALTGVRPRKRLSKRATPHPTES